MSAATFVVFGWDGQDDDATLVEAPEGLDMVRAAQLAHAVQGEMDRTERGARVWSEIEFRVPMRELAHNTTWIRLIWDHALRPDVTIRPDGCLHGRSWEMKVTGAARANDTVILGPKLEVA